MSHLPRINYKQAQELVFISGTVADGYNGHRTHVGFAFDPASGKTLIVHDCGFHLAIIPPAIDQSEALWLLNNHPSARRIYKVQ